MLSYIHLSKFIWAEALTYACYFVNKLPSSAIESKTPLKVWSEKTAQDHYLLRVFESPAYFSSKDGKMNSRAKKFVFLGVKKNERLQVMGPRKQEDCLEPSCHI